MRLLFGLTCASIVFFSAAFAQTDLDQLCQARKDAENDSRDVCASANQQADAFRHDHAYDFRRARTPQEAGQIIGDINAQIAELRKPCADANAKVREAGANLLAQLKVDRSARQQAEGQGLKLQEDDIAWLRKELCLPAR